MKMDAASAKSVTVEALKGSAQLATLLVYRDTL